MGKKIIIHFSQRSLQSIGPWGAGTCYMLQPKYSWNMKHVPKGKPSFYLVIHSPIGALSGTFERWRSSLGGSKLMGKRNCPNFFQAPVYLYTFDLTMRQIAQKNFVDSRRVKKRLVSHHLLFFRTNVPIYRHPPIFQRIRINLCNIYNNNNL